MAVIIPVVSKFDDKGIKQAQSAFSGLGASMKGILGAAGIAVGFSAIASGIRESTKAAIEDTKSQALLANQLRNTINATDGQITSVEASIKAMQLQASVADDVIRPAFASLVRATGDVTQATQLTSLALDVAAGTGKDLGSVSLALGKYLNGSKKSLELLVPSIKGASDPMGELAKQFDGASKAAANNDPLQRLTVIFGEMQEQIGMALLPYLEDFANYMASDSGQQDIKDFADAIISVADAVKTLTPLVGDLFAGFKTVPAAFTALLNGDPGEFIKIMGMATGDALKYINSKEADKTRLDPGLARALAGRTVTGSVSGIGGAGGGKTGSGAKTTAVDYVKEFATSMADELRKQMARIRLGNKGLSAELIESIVGSGKSWYTVYQSILNSSDTALGRLQKNWNATAAGIKELEDISKAAADAAEEIAKAGADAIKKLSDDLDDANRAVADAAADVARLVAEAAEEASRAAFEAAVTKAQEIYDVSQVAVNALQKFADDASAEVDKFSKYFSDTPATVFEVYDQAVANLAKLQEESQRTLDDMAKGMADVRAEATSATTAFKDLAKTAEPIGAWEEKLNNSFANLTGSAQKAFDNKLITQDAYKNLMAYANREKALLTDIAKKRDALAEKISLAKALYADTKSAVMGFGNITGLLKSQSETITETTSKMVDGVATTITRSIEKITSTNLVDEYRKIIDKTKAFANNLKALRDQGLNKELFAQIVGAGVDVGGETAAALASAGPAVIGELNGLFADLQTVSDEVAETTTVVMYNNGVEVVGGFINGLLAEDAGLAAAAEKIATVFADTFALALNTAMDSVFAAMKLQLDAAIAAAKKAMDDAKADLKAAQDAAIAAANAAMAALVKAKTDADAAAAALKAAQDAQAAALKAAADAKTAADKKAADDALAKAKADADAAAAALKSAQGNGIMHPILDPFKSIDSMVDDYIRLAPNGGAGSLGFRGGTSQVDGGNIINVTVNAGLGTNGAVLGGQIVDLIKKYEKTSGTVFA